MAGQVLIVEDDAATRAALMLALEAEGYETATAANGCEALDYLRAASPPPCVVLLDMMMPVMDGWQFLAERHKEEALGRVPVIIFTAAGGLDTPGVRAMGAEDILHKPADPDDLLEVVRRYS